MLIAQSVTGERVAIDILNVRFGSKAIIRQFYFWNFFAKIGERKEEEVPSLRESSLIQD